MSTLLISCLEQWLSLMGYYSSAHLVSHAIPMLLIGGLLFCLLGVKVFRPTFSIVMFFCATALLMIVLRPYISWLAVVSLVAVLGIFLAFLALFMKRVAISILCLLGSAILAWSLIPVLVFALIAGILIFVISLFKPREALIGVSSLFGASLVVSLISGVVSNSIFEVSVSTLIQPLIVAGSLGFAAIGALVQHLSSRNGLDPVFTQVIHLPVKEEEVIPSSSISTEGVPASGPRMTQATSESGDAISAGVAGAAGAAAAVVGVRALHGRHSSDEDDNLTSNISDLISKPESENPTFRKEYKYRISELDFLRIRNSLDACLSYDPHSGPMGYTIRSLYFDSMDDRDLYDKLDGTFEHKKIRLRTYDPRGKKFNLEYKCRWDTDGVKRKLVLSRKQAKRLIRCEYEVLLEFDDDPLARELYDRMVRGRYMPKVIVQYHRIAWTYPASDIRVTWDKGIEASYFADSFFEERPLFIPILPDNLGVLEVKYNYFFPSGIKHALNLLDQLPVSNSKYALARTYV